jgi:tetratricopeptide (TPR) repeat protein
MQYSAAGMHKEALASLRRALAVAGADQNLYILLVESYRRAADFQGALEAASEAIQKFPNSSRMNFLLGVRLQALGRLPESRQYFQKSVSLDPNFADGYIALGELARRYGKSQEAVSLLQKALALRPDYPDALLELAKDYKDLGDFGSAEQALIAAVHKDPENPTPHLLLSQIYSAQKNLDKSEKERQIFLELKQRAASHPSAVSGQRAGAPEPSDDK